jgi:hypothetical protein
MAKVGGGHRCESIAHMVVPQGILEIRVRVHAGAHQRRNGSVKPVIVDVGNAYDIDAAPVPAVPRVKRISRPGRQPAHVREVQVETGPISVSDE